MPAFLSEYTLHDSYWIGLHLRPGLEGMAVVRWDTHWSGGRIVYPGSAVADWLVLLIRFERVYRTCTSYHKEYLHTGEPMADAVSEIVAPKRRELLLDHALKVSTSPNTPDEFLLDRTFTVRSSHPSTAAG